MNSMQQSTIRSAVSAATLACSFAFAQDKDNTRPPAQPAPPPWQPVTWIDTIPRDNDEKPCVISSMQIEARVDGVFARVSETLEIRNPNTRPISAPVTFPLPDGAVVCGYALDIDGAMVDGVAVPKEKARVAFETERRRGIDPGIVEAVRGNVWRTSVYPVPASGVRRLRVDWTAPLATGPDGSSAALSLPMPDCALDRRSVSIEVADTSSEGAPTLGGFGDTSFFADASRVWRASGVETNLAPRSDLLIALPRLPDAIAAAEKTPDGDVWFCVSAKTGPATGPAPASAKEPPQSFTVFWDASGSRAGAREAERSLLRSLPAAPNGNFRLVVFRDTTEPERSFATLKELADAAENAACDGGTDFAALAAEIARVAAERPDEPLYLFTDGIDTLSGKPIDFGQAASGRLVAFASGAERDAESLRQACGGLVFDPADGVDATVKAPRRFVTTVSGAGVSQVQGIGSDASRRATATGRLDPGAGKARILLRTGDGLEREFEIDPEAARSGAAIATAWAAARTAALSPRATDNEEELLALARRFGIANPAASLLVLESLDQWLRHDIEPPASLPALREKWTEARKGRMGELTPEAKAERHLENLVTLWRKKMEWWKTDWTKTRAPEAKPRAEADDDGEPPRAAGLVNRVLRRVGLSGATRRESVPSDGMAAPMAARMAMVQEDAEFEASGVMAAGAPEVPSALQQAQKRASGATASAISVKAWSPDTPYLAAIAAAAKTGEPDKRDAARAAYIAQRAEWAGSPAFFLDCAGWFFDNGDAEFAVRVLSNLAEMRIEDPALLRVMAWRLRQAGAYRQAAVALRRVCRLRPEEGQSWRDLALTLDAAARAADDIGEARTLAREALALYRKTALTPWLRHADDLAVFAVEEHNALLAWARAADVLAEPDEELPEELRELPDCDIRIVMAWDADETDVDLHVTEPTGEEAYYGHRRTHIGGDVSRDITDGYGPEEYMLHAARKGAYKVRAHYFASHRQEVFGPATATATFFTNWGRPDQSSQTLSVRLDKEKRMLDLGEVTFESPR